MNLTNTDVDEEEIDEDDEQEANEDEEVEEDEESDDPDEVADAAEAADAARAADDNDVICPECDAEIDKEIKRGDQITCPECNCKLEVLDTEPAHLILAKELKVALD
jgi:alpha-aminoadipate carrier LysW-like protein